MAKKSIPNIKKTRTQRSVPQGKNLLLTLSLVPLVIGFLLLGAWVLDLEILPDAGSQITVAIFFFLLSFTLTNLIQKRWRLALGWGLLAAADIIALGWLNVVVQVIALTLGAVGLVFLGIEFYRQYKK